MSDHCHRYYQLLVLIYSQHVGGTLTTTDHDCTAFAVLFLTIFFVALLSN